MTAVEISPAQEAKPPEAVPAAPVQAAAVPMATALVTVPEQPAVLQAPVPAPVAPVAPPAPRPTLTSFYVHTHSTGAVAHAAFVPKEDDKMTGLKYGVMGGGVAAAVVGGIWLAYEWITKKREERKAPPLGRPWYRRIYRGEEDDPRTRW